MLSTLIFKVAFVSLLKTSCFSPRQVPSSFWNFSWCMIAASCFEMAASMASILLLIDRVTFLSKVSCPAMASSTRASTISSAALRLVLGSCCRAASENSLIIFDSKLCSSVVVAAAAPAWACSLALIRRSPLGRFRSLPGLFRLHRTALLQLLQLVLILQDRLHQIFQLVRLVHLRE